MRKAKLYSTQTLSEYVRTYFYCDEHTGGGVPINPNKQNSRLCLARGCRLVAISKKGRQSS